MTRRNQTRPNRNDVLDGARRALDDGREVVLSSPQKVCLSGDYGDMRPGGGGQTFTAAVDVRPTLRIRRSSAEKSIILVRGESVDLKPWALVQAFGEELDQLNVALKVDVVPSQLIGLGLGSSGAASVLLSAALAIARNERPSARRLIRDAHEFENLAALYPCGAQDHAASVLGGLNLLTFPGLNAKRVENTTMWPALTFWTSDEPRAAFELIPEIAERHTQPMWERRSEITNRFASAFGRGDLVGVVRAMRDESELQMEIGMATKRQQDAMRTVAGVGGAAKVSGAGGGGVLAVASLNSDAQREASRSLTALKFDELRLQIAETGISWVTSGEARPVN